MADLMEHKNSTSITLNQWYKRTTCHGISDIFSARTKLERVFWFTCLIMSICFIFPGLVYMVRNYTLQNEWVSTTYEEEHDEAYLPKIAVCNYNRLNQTKASTKYHMNDTHLMYINRQFYQITYVFTETLENLPRESEKKQYLEWRNGPYGKNITFEKLLDDLTITCESTLLFLVYNGKLIENPCKRAWQTPDMFFGRCLLLDIPKSFGPITVPGQTQGLKMVLSPNLKDYETGFVNRFLDHGFAMFMFYKTHPDQWISLTPGFNHMISIKAEKKLMSRSSFTYFKFLQGENKRCLEKKEFLVIDVDMQFTKLACQVDCILYTVASHCNCIPISSTATYPTCEPDHMDTCLSNLSRSLNVTFDKVIQVASSSCTSGCEHHCVGVEVKFQLSTSYFLAESKIPELQKRLKAEKRHRQNSKSYLQNIIGIDIYYESLSVFTVEWRERVPIEQLISNIGGLLGLCAGISLLTIVQALFYLCAGLKNIIFMCKGKFQKVDNNSQTD